MTLIETLQAMKDALLENGWCQGHFRAPDGRVCLMGSYTRSGLATRKGVYSFQPVVDALHETPAIGGTSLTSFNDALGRTFNEIMDALDTAILIEKEKSI